jgi:hypothetical protein
VDEMSELDVKCYAGYRADQRPSQFTFRGRQFDVTEIDIRPMPPTFASAHKTAIITSCGMMKDGICGRLTAFGRIETASLILTELAV